jgi:hypothetical protein
LAGREEIPSFDLTQRTAAGKEKHSSSCNVSAVEWRESVTPFIACACDYWTWDCRVFFCFSFRFFPFFDVSISCELGYSVISSAVGVSNALSKKNDIEVALETKR